MLAGMHSNRPASTLTARWLAAPRSARRPAAGGQRWLTPHTVHTHCSCAANRRSRLISQQSSAHAKPYNACMNVALPEGPRVVPVFHRAQRSSDQMLHEIVQILHVSIAASVQAMVGTGGRTQGREVGPGAAANRAHQTRQGRSMQGMQGVQGTGQHMAAKVGSLGMG